MGKATKPFALIKPPEAVSLVDADSPIAGCLLQVPSLTKGWTRLATSAKQGAPVFHRIL